MIAVETNPIGIANGKVDFGGVVKEVCFAYTPEVEIGEYVVVHVGFAISKIDEEEAKRVFAYLTDTGELGEELGEPAHGATRAQA
ncbi:MAG: HypC/HybG/HupF family hydrogenase formation chaperone [Thermoanaerobaculia bacterium]|nr:HypC/HybG/HupF family hydrogenase formation chaperone [Thermoanaerobaculia bacterium]